MCLSGPGEGNSGSLEPLVCFRAIEKGGAAYNVFKSICLFDFLKLINFGFQVITGIVLLWSGVPIIMKS